MAKPSSKRTVRDLIAKRSRQQSVALTAEQLEQVRAAIAHNDGVLGTRAKLGLDVVWKLLRAEYGFAGSRSALEQMVCDALGRSSWAAK